ncbi:hypothetical protein FOZ63_028341, partial [Perkinsus olseni]
RIGFTGAITLNGRVERVGGIREKVVAASLEGLETVVLPSGNKRDWEGIPEELREGLEAIFVEHLNELEVFMEGWVKGRDWERMKGSDLGTGACRMMIGQLLIVHNASCVFERLAICFWSGIIEVPILMDVERLIPAYTRTVLAREEYMTQPAVALKWMRTAFERAQRRRQAKGITDTRSVHLFDLGSGSGVIGASALLAGLCSKVTFVDCSQQAIDTLIDNMAILEGYIPPNGSLLIRVVVSLWGREVALMALCLDTWAYLPPLEVGKSWKLPMEALDTTRERVVIAANPPWGLVRPQSDRPIVDSIVANVKSFPEDIEVAHVLHSSRARHIPAICESEGLTARRIMHEEPLVIPEYTSPVATDLRLTLASAWMVSLSRRTPEERFRERGPRRKKDSDDDDL